MSTDLKERRNKIKRVIIIVVALLVLVAICLVGCGSKYVSETELGEGSRAWHTQNDPALSGDVTGKFTIELSGYAFTFSASRSYTVTLKYSGEDWFGLKVADLVFDIDGDTMILPVDTSGLFTDDTDAPPLPITKVETKVVYDGLVWEYISFDITPYQIDTLRSANKVSIVVQGHQLCFTKKVFACLDAFYSECVSSEIYRMEQRKKEEDKLKEREDLMKGD